MSTPKYPEHEKLAKISDKSQTCGAFLDWLREEKSYTIAEYHVHTDDCASRFEDGWKRCGMTESHPYPVHVNIPKLLAEFFEIDETKLSTEKDAMLEELRK